MTAPDETIRSLLAPADLPVGGGSAPTGAIAARPGAEEGGGAPWPPADKASGLRFIDVVRRYGDHVALDGLTLEVACGETLALLGPNGAGKSTTISLFLGLLRPHSGTVEVFGSSPHEAMARGWVGAMLQQGSGNGLPPGVKVSTAVRMVARLYPRPMTLDAVAEAADIGSLLGRLTHRLSGGEAQRVRFAMAITGSPELLFLDEPTAAMDVHARQTFWRTIREFGEAGRTVVFATHHLDEADNASRVVMINRGRVVADGPGATLKAAAAARQVRFVMDDPDRAMLDGLDGVTDVYVRGNGITLDSLDADATVRDLVGKAAAFRDLEVVGARMEEAFIALTGDGERACTTMKATGHRGFDVGPAGSGREPQGGPQADGL